MIASAEASRVTFAKGLSRHWRLATATYWIPAARMAGIAAHTQGNRLNEGKVRAPPLAGIQGRSPGLPFVHSIALRAQSAALARVPARMRWDRSAISLRKARTWTTAS